jgi:transposase
MKEPRETKKLVLDFGLWTVKYVQRGIKVLFGKTVKEWKARELLIELGFTNQRPLFRAYQQDPEKVEKWINEELPMIIAEAEDEKRTIYY